MDPTWSLHFSISVRNTESAQVLLSSVQMHLNLTNNIYNKFYLFPFWVWLPFRFILFDLIQGVICLLVMHTCFL